MKALILNGNPQTENLDFDTYLNNLTRLLNRNSRQVETFKLAEMNIHYCTGCWACWLKTPGKCVFRDDMDRILPGIVEADLMIFAAPLLMGFVHSVLKKTMDRLIPLFLPYISFYHGECHHYLRYEHIPDLGVLVKKESDTDREDLAIVEESFHRLSLNMRNRLIFMETTETPVEEVQNEISRI